MWIRKWEKDEKDGIESPIPTQLVSNEEFIPPPQTKQQKQWQDQIDAMIAENAKKLNMSKRSFLRSSMGLATAFAAYNTVFGNTWDVHADELTDAAAIEEKFPKGEYFVFDVQAHFTQGYALNFRNNEAMKNMGFNLDNSAEAYSFNNFIKEMYLDSETSMLVISGVPGKEINKGEDGKVLEGRDRSRGLLPSWLMSESRDKINNGAGSVRALCQGNCAPNHYWDAKNRRINEEQLFEQMDREVNIYGINSWKWYCHTDPGRSGNGFQMDDEGMTYTFYDKARELGMKTFSVHKGYSAQSRTLGHLAHPKDVEKAALDNPDLTFIIYHSAIKDTPTEELANNPEFFNRATGDFPWHSDLIALKERHPDGLKNVNVEIGSAFGTTAIVSPEMCMHLIGKNIKAYGVDHVIWGTDCLWWGSTQWVIDAMKRFQISDELCEKFGYSKLTKEDKAKIFGLNAARIYDIDVDAQLKAIPNDMLAQAKTRYLAAGGQTENKVHGWVRA